jgi:hypothetical protein
MDTDKLPDHFVYSPTVIEFVTVAAETCLFLEHASGMEKPVFVSKALQLMSLLYLRTSLLEVPDRYFEDQPERFVTEDDYNDLKAQIEFLLGEHDVYLETFHPDMSLSDTPIAAFISENISDVYQEIKDFAANYQLGEIEIMNDAMAVCLETFAEHWGQKLLNAMRALHQIKYSIVAEEDDAGIAVTTQKLNRESMLGFLRDEDNEQDMNMLL